MVEIAFDRSHGGATGPDLIDFSISINPFGPPPNAVAAYHEAAATIASYPEPYAETFTAAVATYLGLAPANILAGNGSNHLLYLIARVLRPNRPFIVIPTFSEIANSLLTLPTTPQAIVLRRERRFQFDLDALDRALTNGADALFLCRPNSPTGTTLALEDAAALAKRCAARQCWCVIDEAFIDFADDPRSAAALVDQNPWLIVTRSMTKLYAIPGLRLGYLAASESTATVLGRALEPWSVSGPAAAVGIACLAQSENWRNQICTALKAEREYLQDRLGAIAGITVFRSTANFLMFEVDHRARERSLHRHMVERGILVRDLAALPGAGPGLFRIGVRLRADNDHLIEAINAYSYCRFR
jgi:threonine-phosphate decarboxylase